MTATHWSVSPKLKSLFRRERSESNFGIHDLTFIPFHPLLAWFTILFLFPFSFVIDMSLMELIQTWGEPLGTFLASMKVLGFSYSSFKTKSTVFIWRSLKKKTRRILSSHRLKYFKKRERKEKRKSLLTIWSSSPSQRHRASFPQPALARPAWS